VCSDLVDAGEQIAVGPIHRPGHGHHSAGARSARHDLQQSEVHRWQLSDPAAAFPQRRGVTMGGGLGLAGALHEAVGGVLRAAEQGEFDEFGADLLAELLQLDDELDPTEELRDQDVPTCRELEASPRVRIRTKRERMG
jgi:hypothetical protein